VYDDADIFPNYNAHDAAVSGSVVYKGVAAIGLKYFKLFQLHSAPGGKTTAETFIAPGECSPCPPEWLHGHGDCMVALCSARAARCECATSAQSVQVYVAFGTALLLMRYLADPWLACMPLVAAAGGGCWACCLSSVCRTPHPPDRLGGNLNH
jgi:hypothetical protein